MQELMNSFVRLSAAMTVFGMQQMQTAVGSLDAKDSIAKLRELMDSVTNAVSAHIEESRRPALDNMSNLGAGVVDRTFDTLSVDPRQMMQGTGEMVRKAGDSLSGMMKTAGEKMRPASGEPKPAEDVLIVVAPN